MSANEAASFFDHEVKPVSWAWHNPPIRKPMMFAAATSSRDYWIDRAAKYEAMIARDTPPARQDDLGEVD